MERSKTYVGLLREMMVYYASPFSGIDRNSMIPEEHPAHGPPAPPIVKYLEKLFKVSDFSHVGVYLTGDPPSGKPRNHFLDATMHISSEWTHNAVTLKEQGWTLLPLYVSYCERIGNPSAFPGIDAAAVKERQENPSPDDGPLQISLSDDECVRRGIEHAIHIKTIVKPLDMDGAVIYLDNEGSSNGPSRKTIKYLFSMFNELRQDRGDGLPALRPGLYTFDFETFPLHKDHPDAFFWRIDFDKDIPASFFGKMKTAERARTDEPDPMIELDGKIVMRNFLIPLRSARLTEQPRTMIPVGRQGYTNQEGKIVQIPNGPLSRDPDLKPVSPWDINVSFVRDPAFPVGSPRFARLQTSFLQGVPAKTSHAMTITNLEKPGINAIGGVLIEPDSPILLPIASEVFAIAKKTRLFAHSVKNSKGDWGPFEDVPVSLPNGVTLRRIRAIGAVSKPNTQIQVFFVGNDHVLYGTRQFTATSWMPPKPMAGKTLLSPFSNIACSPVSGATDLFFINKAGFLEWAPCFDTAAGDWPGTTHQALQGGDPTLLSGTSIATATPSVGHQLVFAIGRDLRLHMAYFIRGQGWKGPSPIGNPFGRGPNDGDTLFEHSRLAAVVLDSIPKLVQVSALSQKGAPCVYIIAYDEDATTKKGRYGQLLPRTEYQRVMPTRRQDDVYPETPAGNATWWTVNPFGDIDLDPAGNTLTISWAAATSGEVGILQRSISDDEWKVFSRGGARV